MSIRLYKSTVRSLAMAIAILITAIVGAFILLAYAAHDSFRIMSLFGLFDGEIGARLWIVWPVLAVMVAALAWTELVFVRRADALFADTDNPITAFGTSMKDEAKSLEEVRRSLRRYALFIVPLCLAIGFFIGVAFANVLLVAVLLTLQFGLLMFLAENAAILKADASLIF